MGVRVKFVGSSMVRVRWRRLMRAEKGRRSVVTRGEAGFRGMDR